MSARHLGVDFSTTVQALLGSLPVSQIASSPIACCLPDQRVVEVFADERWRGYDTLGVCEGETVIGILRRISDGESKSAFDLMEQPAPEAVLPPSAQMTTAIRLLPEHDPLLLREGSTFTGIVTRSDLLRLPVRLLCFALVAQLEMVMAKAIRSRCAEDMAEWWSHLSKRRQKNFLRAQKRLKDLGMDPSPVELLEFCDKKTVLAKLLGLPGRFKKDLGSVEHWLRNPIAHSSDFLGPGKDAGRVLKNLRACYHWSQTLRKHYRLDSGSFTELEEVGKALFGDGWEQERESWDEAIPEHTEVDA